MGCYTVCVTGFSVVRAYLLHPSYDADLECSECVVYTYHICVHHHFPGAVIRSAGEQQSSCKEIV